MRKGSNVPHPIEVSPNNSERTWRLRCQPVCIWCKWWTKWKIQRLTSMAHSADWCCWTY